MSVPCPDCDRRYIVLKLHRPHCPVRRRKTYEELLRLQIREELLLEQQETLMQAIVKSHPPESGTRKVLQVKPTITKYDRYYRENAARIRAGCPPIRPLDEAVRNRLIYIPFLYSFLSPEKYKREPGTLAGDPNIKDWLSRPDVQVATMLLILGAYEDQVPKPPNQVLLESREWIESEGGDLLEQLEGIVQQLEEDPEGSPYVRSSPLGKYILCPDLNTLAKEAGLECSSTKLGKLLCSLGYEKRDIKIDKTTKRVYLLKNQLDPPPESES